MFKKDPYSFSCYVFFNRFEYYLRNDFAKKEIEIKYVVLIVALIYIAYLDRSEFKIQNRTVCWLIEHGVSANTVQHIAPPPVVLYCVANTKW